MAGDADLRLTDVIRSRAADYGTLLAPDVVVHSGETVTGREAGIELLKRLQPTEDTKIYRHHDVAALVFSDGRVLLMQRNTADEVTRVVELPKPGPNDGMPWQGVEYDKAWNTNEEAPRMALLNAVFATNGRYVDSDVDVIGPEGVNRTIDKLRKVVSSASVQTTTGMTDAGGGWRTWDWVIKSGSLTWFNGFDVMHLDADGKIDFLAGFFVKRKP